MDSWTPAARVLDGPVEPPPVGSLLLAVEPVAGAGEGEEPLVLRQHLGEAQGKLHQHHHQHQQHLQHQHQQNLQQQHWHQETCEMSSSGSSSSMGCAALV